MELIKKLFKSLNEWNQKRQEFSQAKKLNRDGKTIESDTILANVAIRLTREFVRGAMSEVLTDHRDGAELHNDANKSTEYIFFPYAVDTDAQYIQQQIEDGTTKLQEKCAEKGLTLSFDVTRHDGAAESEGYVRVTLESKAKPSPAA